MGMRIMIPVDCEDRFKALITPLENIKTWAVVELNEGQIVDVKYNTNKRSIQEWVDYVVLENHDEYMDQFTILNMSILVAPYQKSIDEIIESFFLEKLESVEI